MGVGVCEGEQDKDCLVFWEGVGGSWACWVQSWGPGMGIFTLSVGVCVCLCVQRNAAVC